MCSPQFSFTVPPTDPVLQPDVEPPESTRSSLATETKAPTSRRSLSKLRRELSDEELGTPAVQRMLLDDIERLENEARDAEEFRDKFHTADKQVAIYEEKFKAKIAVGVIETACIAVGGTLLGFTSSLWSTQPMGYISLGAGVVILGAGVIAKGIKP